MYRIKGKNQDQKQNLLDRGFKHAAMTGEACLAPTGVHTSHFSSSRMKRPMHLFQILTINMRINLRC